MYRHNLQAYCIEIPLQKILAYPQTHQLPINSPFEILNIESPAKNVSIFHTF